MRRQLFVFPIGMPQNAEPGSPTHFMLRKIWSQTRAADTYMGFGGIEITEREDYEQILSDALGEQAGIFAKPENIRDVADITKSIGGECCLELRIFVVQTWQVVSESPTAFTYRHPSELPWSVMLPDQRLWLPVLLCLPLPLHSVGVLMRMSADYAAESADSFRGLSYF